VTEPVEFDVPDAGAPNLEGGDQVGEQPAGQFDQQPIALPVPGWTQDEAARVIGGAVAGLTTVLYVMRYQAPPAPELVPQIAGDPPREFPLMGMSLAPILDLLAPKGSLQAIGVGLGAGFSELMGAMARRLPVLQVAPKDGARHAAAAAPASPAPPGEATPAAAAGEGFRFQGDQLRVLRQAAEEPLTGLGLA
jgi:hypothetical protein